MPKVKYIVALHYAKHIGSLNNRATNNVPQYNENPFDTMGPTMEPMMDTTSVDNDPFASFGEKVEISDNELPF